MDLQHLWERLSLPVNQLAVFKADLAEGKVPELPFYIIGQQKVKDAVSKKLQIIDSARMTTSLIIAEYGNGKTNLLKYLELFFRTYSNLGVSVEYSRADVERTDLVLFLIKTLQDKYVEHLVEVIKIIRDTPDIIPTLANNFQSNFREIKEYTNKLFDPQNDDDAIVEIIYLGTGRLANKRYFDKWQLEQLKDFNRREVFVLFLNILSHAGTYLVFAIDEIEKIREKSKIRFSHFLTSYRELVDLFNQIKGHYLMVSFTDSVGANEISTTNDALYTRIKNDIINIEALSKKEDVQQLIAYMDELFETHKNLQDVYANLVKVDRPNNRVAIQEIAKLLYDNQAFDSLEVMLKQHDLTDLYQNMMAELEDDEAFKNLHRKFFDPLEYYFDSINLNTAGLRKQDRTFIDSYREKVDYFIFNNYLEDYANEAETIQKLIDENSGYQISVFAPVKLELTLSKLELMDSAIEIVDFEPRELFTLLALYKENYDFQPVIGEVIDKYTRQKL